MKEVSVIVIDVDDSFLELVSPVVARKLLSQGVVKVHCRDPFIIKMMNKMKRTKWTNSVVSLVKWNNK